MMTRGSLPRAVFAGALRPWPQKRDWPLCQHCGVGVREYGARVIYRGGPLDKGARAYVWHARCFALFTEWFIE